MGAMMIMKVKNHQGFVCLALQTPASPVTHGTLWHMALTQSRTLMSRARQKKRMEEEEEKENDITTVCLNLLSSSQQWSKD